MVRAGDTFTIRARYDNGGYKRILVTRVHGRHVYVRDLEWEGRFVSDRAERRLSPRWSARLTLERFWKRCKQEHA